jgi:DNA-binding NtrC family response regulator
MPGGNANACLLVVDDSPDARELLQRNLSSQGYEVLTAAGMAEALSILATTHVDLVLTDLKMPHASGLDLVRHVHENLKETEVIMVTGYPSVEGAVTAVKSGAQEYLSKPFTKDELLAAVGRVMEKLSLRKATLKSMRQPSNPLGMVGESDPMLKVFKAALKAAVETTPVYLMGENGTGRERLAKAIHAASPRAAAPFVTVNCFGTEPESFEKQLLGYIMKTSLGAMESHEGFFQFLDGGTLHLKNVSQLPDALQSTLFRVLEEREFRVIG